MKKLVIKLYYKIFKHYEILERRCVTYIEAGNLMANYHSKLPHEKWVLDTEKEDNNKNLGIVYLCRKKRILK